MQRPPLPFSFLPGLLVPFLIPLFFFSSFFHPTQLLGDFSCPFTILRSSANVQQVLYENCSICRCILDVLVRSDEFCILLFRHLDSSPNFSKFISHLSSPKNCLFINFTNFSTEFIFSLRYFKILDASLYHSFTFKYLCSTLAYLFSFLYFH